MAKIEIKCGSCRKLKLIRGTNQCECKHRKRFILDFADPCENWLPSKSDIRLYLERERQKSDEQI